VSNKGSNGVDVKRHLRYALDQIAERDRNGLEGYFRGIILLRQQNLNTIIFFLTVHVPPFHLACYLALYCPERINPILF
jgi:hypothetical protein